MLTKKEVARRRKQIVGLFRKAGIVITKDEEARVEIADLGLGQFEQTGLGLLMYVNTQRCCAKELGMLPRQTCPEHRHPPIGGDPGKEETFRCRWGRVFLHVPGPETRKPRAKPPAGREHAYTARHEIVLRPGDQYTLAPNTLHWFQAGDEGAVISEFSTRSTDENDLFTDPQIVRVTRVEG